MTDDRRIRLARTARDVETSDLRDVLALVHQPGILSFALGMPSESAFPMQEIAEASAELLRSDPRVLQYAMPSTSLKDHVVELMRLRGVECTPDRVFLTTGAQQGMSLLAHLLVDPGDSVLVENIIYEGILTALQPLNAQTVTIPTDPYEGLDVDEVKRRLSDGTRPAFIYSIPEGHNPLGVSLTSDRRAALADLAELFQVPILEDDAYGFLRYAEDAPLLYSLQSDWVFYLGSFSKILAPGFRVGWIVLPEDLTERLTTLKQGLDIDVTTFSQRVVAACLDALDVPTYLNDLRRHYRRRRDALLEAMEHSFPDVVRWNHPGGGLYVWVEMPRGFDAVQLLRRAVEEEQVAFSPGTAFTVGGGEHANHCFRLCFSARSTDEIDEGIRRLGRILHKHLCADSTNRSGACR